MYECPIEYFTDNLIFNRDKSCWASFELTGFDYDMLSDEGKITILDRLTLFIANIATEAKFIILPVTQDLDNQIDGLIKGLDKKDVLHESAVFQAEQTREYLKNTVELNGKSNDYKTFVMFKLQKSETFEILGRVKDAFSFFVSAIIKDFNAFMNIDTTDIAQSKIDNFEKLSNQAYLDQTKRLALIAVDTERTQWLIRRVMYRGLPRDIPLYKFSKQQAWQPKSDKVTLAGKEYIRPKKREMANLFSGVISRQGRNIAIKHDTETSYQTFLTITNIPADLSFPDCEWIYLLQQYNKQAEMCITIKNIEHREAIKKIDFQRRATNSQMDNIDHAGEEIPDDLLLSKDDIEGLEAELKADKSPLVHASIVIALSDTNPEELEKKAVFIRKEYEDLNFIVERPLTDQLELFMECMPSVGFCIQDFVLKIPPNALASGIIGATHELGDYIGYYVGTTGIAGKHVFADFRQAPLTNRSASATFYGNLGVGKSFNANMLFYLHVLYGAYGIIIDPKGERTHWVTDLKVFEGLINLVTLSPEKKYKGMLDPYNVFRHDIEAAAELSISVLSDLFKLKQKDLAYTALLDATDRMKKEQKPSHSLLVKILNTFAIDDDLYKAARMLSRQLRLLESSGMAHLLIGDGTEAAIELKNRINIIQIQNLKMPEKDAAKDDYTQEETVSMALMSVTTAFVRKFVHSFPNNFKIALFDESWMLGKTTEGEKLMSYVGRMARSLYAGMILNGHSVTDLPNEGIKNTITYKFCFKTSSTDEAKRMLEYMNLETTKANIELIMNLRNAECLFQDLNGRVGVLKFDAVFQDLIDVFSTTPTDKSTLEDTQELAGELDATQELVEGLESKTYLLSEINIFAYED